MPTGHKKPTPPHLIAANGHIAAALREYMTTHGLSVGDLNQLLGLTRAHTSLYHYLNAKKPPTENARNMLHKVTGISLEMLMPRKLDTPTQVAVRDPQHVVLRPMTVTPVLSFTVNADGTARIKLDAAMPLATASPLLRILLDAGLVPSTQGDEDNGS